MGSRMETRKEWNKGREGMKEGRNEKERKYRKKEGWEEKGREEQGGKRGEEVGKDRRWKGEGQRKQERKRGGRKQKAKFPVRFQGPVELIWVGEVYYLDMNMTGRFFKRTK